MNIGIRIRGLALVGLLIGAIPSVRAEDPSEENKRLKARIVELESRLKMQEKQIDLLKRELDQLRPSRTKGDNPGSSKLLENLAAGTVLAGPYENLQDGLTGEIRVEVTERQSDFFKGRWTLKSRASTQTGELEGKIFARRLTWKSIGSRSQATAAFLLVGDELEGTWASSIGGNGPLSLKLAK